LFPARKFLIILFNFLVTTPPSSDTKFHNAYLNINECLFINEKIYSEKDCFVMTMQKDGNLSVKRTKDQKQTWSSNSSGTGGEKACLMSKKKYNFEIF
jgi:hypothetical protein